MAVFSIYRYNIEHDDQLVLDFKKDEQSHSKLKSPYEIFEGFFGKPEEPLTHFGRMVYPKNSTPEWEEHHAKIEQHIGSLIAFSLQAKRSKMINKQNWTAESENDFPPCRVIIDNRANRHLLIIEQKLTAFSRTEIPGKIIEESINKRFMGMGLVFSLVSLEKEAGFWQGVDEIRTELNDKVQRVQFDFKSKDKVENDKNCVTDIVMRWVSQFASGCDLSLEIGDDARLNNVKEDLTRMAELCTSNKNYGLFVYFKKFGLYRFGQNLKAQYGMEDSDVENFIKLNNVSKEQELFKTQNIDPFEQMSSWFDCVNKLFENYDEKKTLGRRRKPRTRK